MQYGNLCSLQDLLSNYRVNLSRGLHPKAPVGVISNFTDIDSVSERPEHLQISLNSAECKVEELVSPVLTTLTERD